MAQPRMLVCVFVAMLTASRPAAAQVESAAQPMAVLDNVDLMDLMLKPAYDSLQRAMARAPADRQDWASLYQQAAKLAELENLLFFRTRADESRRPEWLGRAARARRLGRRRSGGAARPSLRQGRRFRARPRRASSDIRGVHRMPPRLRARSACDQAVGEP